MRPLGASDGPRRLAPTAAVVVRRIRPAGRSGAVLFGRSFSIWDASRCGQSERPENGTDQRFLSGNSRMWAGIHFIDANRHGVDVGRKVGRNAWTRHSAALLELSRAPEVLPVTHSIRPGHGA